MILLHDLSSPFFSKICNVVDYVPPNCRWVPGTHKILTLPLNLLYAFAMTFTVANLYYNQPILTVLADDFKVTHERVSLIPTLTQAGYAFGLVLICPLGDMFRRRPLVLLLVFVTATLWIGLLITKNFTAFAVLTFLVSFLGVTPQLMMPLVAE
jgi:MFS family permease